MKFFIAILSSFLLCSCADMWVTNSTVGGSGSVATATSDTKDYGSIRGVHMISCGVGAYHPRAIYIRPFCVDNAVFRGDIADSDGEVAIRKALAPVQFAYRLKEQFEKLAPTRILHDDEVPRVGWLVDGEFTLVDGGNKEGRFFAGTFGVGQSHLVMHVRVTSAVTGAMLYEFDVAGGSELQGRHGTVRASGLGHATPFDMQNAAERIYLALSPDPWRHGARADVSLR